MYAAPPAIRAQVFTRLPDDNAALRRQMAELRAEVDNLLERLARHDARAAL